MDKYRLQPKSKENQVENEIRVKASGIIWNYISYAATMLLEKKMQSIVFKGTGNAIPKIVILAELLRRRIANLHQESRITNVETTDTYVPLEEGLDTITTTRRLTCLEIELSRTEQNPNSCGYQPPLPQSEVKELPLEQLRNVRRPFRGVRGGRGQTRGGPRGGSRGGPRGGRVYRGGARGGRSFRGRRGSFGGQGFGGQGNTRGDFGGQRSRGRTYRGGNAPRRNFYQQQE